MLQSIIAIGTTSVFVSLLLSSYNMVQKENNVVQSNYQMSNLRSKIFNQVNFKQSWYNTYATDKNIFKKCVEGTAPYDCTEEHSARSFHMLDAANKPLVSAGGSYFTKDGSRCYPENEQACLFKVVSKWKPICDDDMCYQVSLGFQFYTQVDNKWERREKYDFNVVKNMTFGGNGKVYTVDLEKTQEVSATADVKIIIIVDPSDSMVTKEARVINSLTNLLLEAKNVNAKVYFYSTASTELTYAPWTHHKDRSLASWNLDIGEGGDYEGAKDMLTYEVVQDGQKFSAQLQPDVTKKIGIEIQSGLPEQTLRENIQKVFDYLTPAVGTDRESGICALTRIVNDEGPNRILTDKDSAHFVFISDEDDYMAIGQSDHCEKSVTVTSVNVAADRICNIDEEKCDYANTFALFRGTEVRIKGYIRLNDTILSRGIPVCSPDKNYVEGESCPWDSMGFGDQHACDERALSFLKKFRDENHPGGEIVGCQLQKKKKTVKSWVTLKNEVPASVYESQLDPLKRTNCENWLLGDNTSVKEVLKLKKLKMENYTDCHAQYRVKDQIQKSVHINEPYYKMPSHSRLADRTGSSFKKLDLPIYYQNIIDSIKQKVADYSLTAIVHNRDKDQAGCDIGGGSYGDSYVDFLNYSNSPNNYYSICATSFNVPFKQLKKKIEAAVSNVYYFDKLSMYEELTGIRVIRDGEEVFVQPSSYTISRRSVTFQTGILKAGDSVIVEIGNKVLF